MVVVVVVVGEMGELPIMAYMESLRPKGVPFFSFEVY